jgi:hypothetical protein
MAKIGAGVSEMRAILAGMSDKEKRAWRAVEAPARRLDPWRVSDETYIEQCYEKGHSLMNLKIVPASPIVETPIDLSRPITSYKPGTPNHVPPPPRPFGEVSGIIHPHQETYIRHIRVPEDEDPS